MKNCHNVPSVTIKPGIKEKSAKFNIFCKDQIYFESINPITSIMLMNIILNDRPKKTAVVNHFCQEVHKPSNMGLKLWNEYIPKPIPDTEKTIRSAITK